MAGMDVMRVLKRVDSVGLVWTRRKMRAMRATRSRVASEPRLATMPTHDRTTMVKSNRFQFRAKYSVGPSAYSLRMASIVKMVQKM